MSCSIFKFLLLANGIILVASSTAKPICAQDFSKDPIAQQKNPRQNKMQKAIGSPPDSVGSLPQATNDELVAKKIAAAAQKIGLDGRWIVLNVDHDGELTNAQIGQQPNDVISIIPGENNRHPLSFR